VTKLVGNGRRMKVVLQAINNQPIKFGLLIRTLPLSTGIQTAILCISSIEFRTFLLTSIAAEMPQQFLYVYLGTQMSDLTSILSGQNHFTTEQLMIVVIQVVGTIAVIITMFMLSQREFKRIEQERGEVLNV